MHVLVLGSSGQIGSPLTSFLRSKSINVTEFDLCINPLHDLRISQNYSLLKIIQTEPIDFVIFLAFDVGGAKYLEAMQGSLQFISNNMRIMESTFQILNDHKIRFIFASSQMSELKESTYGTLKNVGEKYTRALNGIPVRFWNIYGQESDEKKFHVISDFIRMALSSSEIRMLTDGTEKRDFLHATDASKAILKILERYEEFVLEEEVHVASHKWHSINDIAAIISRITGCKITRSCNQDQSRIAQQCAPNPKYSQLVQNSISLEDGIEELISRKRLTFKNE